MPYNGLNYVFNVPDSMELGYTSFIMEETPEGFVKCLSCDAIWCTHVEKSLRLNLDAPTLWERDDADFPDQNNDVPSRFIAKIPLYPSRNLYATISFSTCGIEDTRKLFFEDFPTNALPPLGYAHKGEGRVVVRTLIVDWFQGVVDPSNLQCAGASHNFATEMRWQQDVTSKNLGLVFAQYWSVFTTRMCLDCNGNIENLDLEDLVPKEERRRFGS